MDILLLHFLTGHGVIHPVGLLAKALRMLSKHEFGRRTAAIR
jgi:hypothetical protein